MPLLRHLSRRIHTHSVRVDELMQAGYLGMLQALPHYDTNRGIQFITYAVPWILGEMKKTLRKNSDAQFTVSMQEELGEDGVTLEETLSGSDNIDFSGLELRIALSQLDSEEQRLICLRYFRDKTQKETADLLKRSQAQISRMEHKALDKLHNIMIE